MSGVSWKQSEFGRYLVFDCPPLADIVIVSSIEDGVPMRPRAIKLPHQLYVETIRAYMGTGGIAIQPARSSTRLILDRAQLREMGVTR